MTRPSGPRPLPFTLPEDESTAIDAFRLHEVMPSTAAGVDVVAKGGRTRSGRRFVKTMRVCQRARWF
jgi:hypothetical protein